MSVATLFHIYQLKVEYSILQLWLWHILNYIVDHSYQECAGFVPIALYYTCYTCENELDQTQQYH